MFSYSFKDMYDWYVENIDNAVVFEQAKNLSKNRRFFDKFLELRDKALAVYEIKATKKYEKLSDKKVRALKLRPVPKSNMGYLGLFANIKDIARFKSIGTESPNGLYCVLDDSNLYAVFPVMKGGHMFADHLSFMSDNVHLTTYEPDPLDPNTGTFLHVPKCSMVAGTSLPLSGYECAHLDRMGQHKATALDIARAYKTYAGGGKGLRVPVGRSTAANKPDVSSKLEHALLKNNTRSMTVFCLKNGASWDVLVMNDGNVDGLRFSTGRLGWPSVQKRIVELLSDS